MFCLVAYRCRAGNFPKFVKSGSWYVTPLQENVATMRPFPEPWAGGWLAAGMFFHNISYLLKLLQVTNHLTTTYYGQRQHDSRP